MYVTSFFLYHIHTHKLKTKGNSLPTKTFSGSLKFCLFQIKNNWLSRITVDLTKFTTPKG